VQWIKDAKGKAVLHVRPRLSKTSSEPLGSKKLPVFGAAALKIKIYK